MSRQQMELTHVSEVLYEFAAFCSWKKSGNVIREIVVAPLKQVAGTDLVGAVPPQRQEGHLGPDERHVLGKQNGKSL